MPLFLRLAVLMLALAAPTANAQEAGGQPDNIFSQGFAAPKQDFGMSGAFPVAPLPYSTGGAPPPSIALPGHRLTLEAHLDDKTPALRAGVDWRVFDTEPGDDGHLRLVASESGGSASVRLVPGDYFINAAFGRASATKRVTIGNKDQVETVVLNAGGLRLGAVVGDDAPIDPAHVTFEISQETDEGVNAIIAPEATANSILRLSAGTYHVISRYGTANAVVRADIEVEPGKLTEVVIRHAGAEVTLKLVSDSGGEALANTSWTVLTEGGDTVHESVGAFPSLILAEGKYTAVASHEGKAYSHDFTIESGVDRDVEVLLTDLVKPER